MNSVPTMSTRGFLTSVVDAANEEMLNFYLCHHDQSENFAVDAVPLSKLLQAYGDNPHEFSSQIKKSLEIWLARTFTTVEVEAQVEDPEASTIKVQIGVIIRENGTNYQLNQLLVTKGTRFIEVLNGAGDIIIKEN